VKLLRVFLECEYGKRPVLERAAVTVPACVSKSEADLHAVIGAQLLLERKDSVALEQKQGHF
jgi:hypothetical protein